MVAGTHGKTTTTSLLAFLLDQAGLDPSFLIGGVPVGLRRAATGSAAGTHFVVEGDEYDSAFFDKRPKFVHYLPDVAVIGNLEYDHADIYPDLAAVQLAFARLIQLIPRRGLLVAGIESAPLREILPRALCRVETFGARRAEADWRGGGRAAGAGRRLAVPPAARGPGPRRVPRASSPASTTSATRSRPSPLANAVGVAPEKAREILAALPRREAPPRGARARPAA